MELPDFSSVDLATQLCFAIEYGVWEWPATDCCPPPKNATSVCEPPSWLEILTMYLAIPIHELTLFDRVSNTVAANVITPYDYQLFAAGVAVLMQNFDIISWVTCLVQQWSPDMKGLDLTGIITDLLTLHTDGTFSWNVTYVNSTDTGATMWAFVPSDVEVDVHIPYIPTVNDGKVGIIVHIGTDWWNDIADKWKNWWH